jgi:hypothetical protein
MTTPPSRARALAETLYVTDTADDLRLWIAAIEAHDGETIEMAIKYHEDQAAILRTGPDVNRERPSITMFGGREQAAQWHEQYAAGIRALLTQSPAPDPRDAALKLAEGALDKTLDLFSVIYQDEVGTDAEFGKMGVVKQAREALAAIGRVEEND